MNWRGPFVGKYDHWHAGMTIHNFRLIQRVPDNKSLQPIHANRWIVECLCEKKTRLTVPRWYLVRPDPKRSCGCLNRTSRTVYKREYGIWQMMRRRCNNPTHRHYKYYGGRGIKVFPEWDDLETGFEKWLAYVGPAPTKEHTIDRFPDNDGTTGYFPGNIRWATPTQQRANQRTHHEDVSPNPES